MTAPAPCPIERARTLLHGHISLGFADYGTHWPNLSFSIPGAARVGSILGYGLAMAESGVEQLVDFGHSFLRDFFHALDGLNDAPPAHQWFEQTDSLQQAFGYDKHAPCRLTRIHDDGTPHGLSFLVYRLVRQDIYNERFQEFFIRHCAKKLGTKPFEARCELRRAMLNEFRGEWNAEARREFHAVAKIDDSLTRRYSYSRYSFSHNGGLLYHGQGNNPLAVSLSTRLFGTHT